MVETLGQYRILDRIGSGGIGEVYRARDTRHGRTVAVRIVGRHIAGDSDRRERFLRHAHAAAALSHPNIAVLYEIGEDQQQLFLAFEFVPGEALAHVVGGSPLPPRRAIDFAAQIADALADAHAHGIVHQRLTSANIIITPKEKAKILDFGLAQWTSGAAARSETADDIVSLGALLFEMLTGQPPFAGTTSAEPARRIAPTPPIAPSAITRSVPSELDAIVAKALAQNRDERYQAAATLAADLRSVAAILDARAQRSESSIRRPPTGAKDRRRSAFIWMVLALLVAGLAAAAWCASPLGP